jgi:hypothetical protein
VSPEDDGIEDREPTVASGTVKLTAAQRALRERREDS